MIRAQLLQGDCCDSVIWLPDNSIDSCVTDPPYAINFMGRGWDTGEVAYSVGFWRQVFRVLKPGGHLATFGATRTYHRMACAIEDAGFEIRDQLAWTYGSGFPKSLNVSKAIDKAAGVEREVVGSRPKNYPDTSSGYTSVSGKGGTRGGGIWHEVEGEVRDGRDITAPATDAAREWEGWGTALKPAWEPIVLARKPLSEPTVAANVLSWRTGALNIDGCRVETEDQSSRRGGRRPATHEGYQRPGATMYQDKTDWSLPAEGRWPANLVTDGSDEVVGMFPQAKSRGAYTDSTDKPATGKQLFGSQLGTNSRDNKYAGETGSAARFFYSAKASKEDRAGSKHPTVKPIALMRWLTRLVTPPSGTVLDPFAGSGTTGAACAAESFNVILCERESEYVKDIKRRFAKLKIPLEVVA